MEWPAVKLTRRQLDLEGWKQTLFLDDPRTWRLWSIVAWLLPLGALALAGLVCWLWRLGEIR